jgi:hypothetical protein
LRSGSSLQPKGSATRVGHQHLQVKIYWGASLKHGLDDIR